MNAAYWHLILNHVPIIGTAFGIPFLIVGMIRRSHSLISSAFWIFIVVAVFSIAAYMTGEPAAEMVAHIPGLSESQIARHENAATTALIGALALGVLSGIGLAAHSMRKQIGRITIAVVFLCSIVVFVLMAAAANQGGLIRHQEITGQSPGSNPGLTAPEPSSTDSSGGS